MEKSKIIYMGILLTAFLVTGCVQTSQPQQTQTVAPTKKKLVIATDAGYYPFEMMDKNGKLVGYDIDLANALGEHLNVEIEIKSYTGIASVIAALQSQKADLAIAAMVITDKRKESIDFSEPYFESYHSIGVNNKHKDMKNWEELDKPGMIISVVRGSGGDNAAQKIFKKATIKQFDGTAEAGQAVLNNQADAVVTLDTWMKVFKIYNPDKITILEQRIGQPQFIGVGVNKGDKESIDRINVFLKQYKESGAAAKNYEKWFESSAWKDLVPAK